MFFLVSPKCVSWEYAMWSTNGSVSESEQAPLCCLYWPTHTHTLGHCCFALTFNPNSDTLCDCELKIDVNHSMNLNFLHSMFLYSCYNLIFETETIFCARKVNKYDYIYIFVEYPIILISKHCVSFKKRCGEILHTNKSTISRSPINSPSEFSFILLTR